MKKIALIKFVDGPWDRMIQDIFYKVLINEGSFNVTKLHDYPKNNPPRLAKLRALDRFLEEEADLLRPILRV